MRGAIITGCCLALLAGSLSQGVVAQGPPAGEEAAPGEPAPGEAVPGAAADGEAADGERIEVAEAGIALSFPVGWSVDIEMDQREDVELSEEVEGAAPAVYWNVLYASAAGRPWCEVTWYPEWPLSLAEHAAVYEARMLPSTWTGVERAVEVAPVEFAGSDAFRIDIYNEPTDDHTLAFLFGSGVAHYLLSCVADTREELDGLHVIDTIELLARVPPEAEAEAGQGADPDEQT